MIPKSLIDAERAGLQHQHVSRGAFLAAMLVVAAASVALRGEATPDVSWLITMCERVLNGERAYVDIVETTPPAPMLLYMPGAVIAKTIGGAPETWTFAFAYASAFGSLWLAARILPTHLADGGLSRLSDLCVVYSPARLRHLDRGQIAEDPPLLRYLHDDFNPKAEWEGYIILVRRSDASKTTLDPDRGALGGFPRG
jgi:hypothetical protein